MCEKTVYEFCNKHTIRSCKLLLAVSGGCDSVALFYLFVDLRERLNINRIGIAHVNHGLRPEESDREEEFVSRLAKQEGCAFYSKKLQGKAVHDTGVEEWAREQRYRFFAEVKEKYGYRFVATGHTADDQAETVLMRIARGSGFAGLCGVQAVRKDGIIRPLITLRRKNLKAWLEEHEHIWHEDSSNTDQRYKRNWIRHTLIPVLTEREPHTIENLAAFAGYMQEQMCFLNPLINKWLTDHVIENEDGRFVIRKPDSVQEHFLASEGIAQLFRDQGISFDRSHIVAFFKGIKRSSGCFLLKGGWQFYPGKYSVEVVSEGKRRGNPRQIVPCLLNMHGTTVCSDAGYNFSTTVHKRSDCNLQYDISNWTVYLDAEKVGQELLFRAITKTDVFQPLGIKNSVNLVRFLKKQRMSSFYRRFVGALAENSSNIVWIPGVAIGHKYRVTAETKTVFRISCQRIS